jgi:hypothetical protein
MKRQTKKNKTYLLTHVFIVSEAVYDEMLPPASQLNRQTHSPAEGEEELRGRDGEVTAEPASQERS